MQTVNETLKQRGQVYGSFLEGATVAQRLKTVVREELAKRDKVLAPDMMEAIEVSMQKISRIISGDDNHLDNPLDICGYFQLVVDRLQGNK